MLDWFFGPSQISKLVIKHSGKNYALSFEKADYTNKDVLLGTLKSKLAPLVDVPAEYLKVYTTSPKRKLSNDKATLASYKVRNNDTLLVVGEKPKPQTASEQIAAAVDAVEKDLGDQIHDFCANPPTTEKARNKEFLVLNEIILQNILKLDNIETDGDQEIRQQRKTAINKLQKYHSEIDSANKRSLELIKQAEQAGTEPTERTEQTKQTAEPRAASETPSEKSDKSKSKSKKKKSKGKKR